MTVIRRFLVLSVASATCGASFKARADEVATLIHRCDLAVPIAEGADKSHGDKVFFNQSIDPTLAVPACEAAAKAAPDNGRIVFQLGLAYDFEEPATRAARVNRKARTVRPRSGQRPGP